MSEEKFPFRDLSGCGPCAGTGPGRAGEDDSGDAPVRRQALEIIGEVLADAAPENEERRAALQRCVSRNPCCPEHALLEYLMTRRSGQEPDAC